MKPSKAMKALAFGIKTKLPILLVGAPGVGKSDIVAQAAEMAGADLIISHPAVADPTDAKGLPWVSKGNKEAEFLPFGDLAKALRATKQTVWFLDDLGQAPPAVQASYMQLLLARRIGEHVLPDCVTFVAATNRRKDKAGVQGILEPVKSRFGSIIEVTPDLDDWCHWAYEAEMPVEVISFLRFRPDLLHVFTPNPEIENFPCPRTWSFIGKMVANEIPEELEIDMFGGAVGAAAAGELRAFLSFYRDIPNIDGILLNPDDAKIPQELSSLYAVSVGLAKRANPTNFGRILRYATRLLEAGKGECAAVIIKDSHRLCPDVEQTSDFMKMMTGPIGELMNA